MTKLTEQVLAYQRDGSGYEELEREVEKWVYYYPAGRPGFTEEDSAEFLLYFRRKIPALLERYTHLDRSFEAYLAKTLKWQIRTYARLRRRRARAHELTRAPEIWDGLIGVAESPEPSGELVGPVTRRLAGARLRRSPKASVARRVVILAMKAAVVISDRQLAEVAARTGYSYTWLHRCREELRFCVERRESRRAALRERRNTAFFRVRILQDELATATGEHRRARLREALDKHTRRLETARARLAHVPTTPTNGEISRTLGVPKGSVDSALHYMKRNLVAVVATEKRN